MTAGEEFLGDFVSYEAKGVPDRAGTDTTDGFDLVINLPLQRRTLHLLPNACMLDYGIASQFCTRPVTPHAGPHATTACCTGQSAGGMASCTCRWHQGQRLNNCLPGLHA